jgi:hypothetical protein
MARKQKRVSPEEKSTSREQTCVPPALPHQGGVPAGRVDVVGPVPEGIRIDPEITEGHPGYEESGDSEIIPRERFTSRKT